MAIQTTEAFVLNRKDFRETSALAVFYSKDFGKIKGILKGIRSERRGYGSLSELFSLNRIVFYEKTRSEFNNITQCDLVDGFFGIRKNLKALAYAAYLVELVDVMTEPGERNDEIYELLYRSFKFLSAGEDADKVVRVFEVRVLTSSGFTASLKNCIHCGAPGASELSEKARFSVKNGGMVCRHCLKEEPQAFSISRGSAQTLNHLQTASLDALLKFKISRSIEGELAMLVEKLLEAHIERPLKSKKFLKEIQRIGQ